ncbi:MAG: GGDEF domain-containing protein [Cyanobacteria bacterium P01_A01_bin.135]
MWLYSLFRRIPRLQQFGDRILVVALVGAHIPLLALVVYLCGHPLKGYQAVLFTVLAATWLGMALTLAALRAYTEPVHAAINALAQYDQQRLLPGLPTHYRDELGQLLSYVQHTLVALDHTLSEVHIDMRDELTQLYNRRFFDYEGPRLLAEAAQQGHPLSLLLGSIDHFDQINAAPSREVGDQVLQQVAAILQQATRSGEWVIRFSEEAFLIALPQASLPQAEILADRLRRAVEAHAWETVHPGLSVTFDIGVADNAGGSSLEAMVADAQQRCTANAARKCIPHVSSHKSHGIAMDEA